MKHCSLSTFAQKVKWHLGRKVKRRWFKYKYKRHNKNMILELGDCKLQLRSNSVLAELLYMDGFEKSERLLIPKIIKPGMTVLDIGANVGLYSVLLGKAAGPSGQVFSFEPYPPSRKCLQENIALNNLNNIKIIDIALSDYTGTAEFNVFPEGYEVYNSLGAQNRPIEKIQAAEKIIVPVKTLDSFVAENGIDHIDVIKLDVEGAEHAVIKGGIQTLTKNQNVMLLVEVYNESLMQMGSSRKELLDTFFSLGFKMFSITENGDLQATDENDSDIYFVFKRK